MHKIRTTADKCVGCFLALLMGIAVFNVLWQVFTRYVLSDPSSFTEEAARYLLLWISVVGASYAVGRKMHLAIDLLPQKFAHRHGGIILDLLIKGCILLFALLVLIIGGLSLVITTVSQGETSPALGVKVGHVYIALPLAGFIMVIYVLMDTIDLLITRRTITAGSPETPR